MKNKHRGYWTKEKCQEAALKCKTKKEFKKISGAYHASIKNNWYNEICSHMISRLPRNLNEYWTKEKCIKVALKCETKKEFKKRYNDARQISIKNNWYNEICSHMILIKQRKPNGYWTKEKCIKVALKCETKKEFKQNYSGAYHVAYENKWLDEICSHMITNKKPFGYWKDKEKCQNVAKLCETRLDFMKKYKGAYHVAYENKWLDEICSHMEIKDTKDYRYWTKEKCQEAALTCKTKSEFKNNFGGACKSAYRNNWYEEICSHMEKIGNRHHRLIYLFEFNDKSVYIGLTYNANKRYKEHFSKANHTSVYKYMEKTGLIPTYTTLTDYMDINDATKFEIYYIDYYKKLGYNILNKTKGGEYGNGYLKWNYDTCKKEASKYTNIKDFAKKHRAYNLSKKNGWLNEFFT